MNKNNEDRKRKDMHFSTFLEWLQSVKSIHYPFEFRKQNYKRLKYLHYSKDFFLH